MKTVTTTYNRFSILENDPQYAVRAAMERFRKAQTEDVANKKNDDIAAFSDQGKALAASSVRSREELEGLEYETLLSFESEDGYTVTVGLALEGGEGEEMYTAARVAITRPDGSEETIYVSSDTTGKPETGEAPETAVPGEENQVAAATEEAMPSLLDLIEEYGLNTTPDASEGLFAAIRARVEAMIKAAAETAEETEALEKIKAERESRNTAETTGTGNEPQESLPKSETAGPSRARTLSSYARNAAASLNTGRGTFSRHY